MRIWIFLILFLIPLGAHSSTLECGKLLAFLGDFTTLSNSSSKNTSAYLNLIKYLAKEKNAISSMSLRKMASENHPPNPMEGVSDPLSSESEYSFNKAFQSLKNIDWEFAKIELKKLADEVERVEVRRQNAAEDTKYIFWPAALKDDVLNTNELKDLSVSLPLDLENHTTFIGWRQNVAYFVDLKKQTTRPLHNMASGGHAILKTRDDHLIAGYYAKNGNLIIEDVGSGGQIESLDINTLFPNNRISRQQTPHIFENLAGGFHITFAEDFKSNVFDTTERRPYVVDRDDGKSEFRALSVDQGRILAQRKNSHSHVNIVQVIWDKTNILLDVDLPKTILSEVPNRQLDTIEYTPSGRIFFIASRDNGFAVYELGHPDPRIIYVEPESYFQLSQKKVIEFPNGEIKVLASRRARSETVFELELIGMNTPVEKISIPPSDKKVSASYGRFPSFFTYLKLHNGRTLFAGLQEIRDVDGALAEKLYIFDDSRNVQTLDVSQFEVTSLRGLQERDDGRIIGYFTNKFNVKALELYRPLQEGKRP